MTTQKKHESSRLLYPGFRGRYDHTIDERGRLVLPVLYRRVFELHYQSFRIYVTRDNERYLIVYPLSVWAEHEAEMIRHIRYSRTVKEQMFISSFYGLETSLDSVGRLLVPRSFREETGLETDVVIIGKINHFEIWDRNRAEECARQLLAGDTEKRLTEIGEQIVGRHEKA